MSSREYKPPEGLQTAEINIPDFALDPETQARIERTKKEIRTLFEEAAKIPADTKPAEGPDETAPEAPSFRP